MIIDRFTERSGACVPLHTPPLILRSRAAASRRMATELEQLMVRDACKGTLLTMRDGVAQ